MTARHMGTEGDAQVQGLPKESADALEIVCCGTVEKQDQNQGANNDLSTFVYLKGTTVKL